MTQTLVYATVNTKALFAPITTVTATKELLCVTEANVVPRMNLNNVVLHITIKNVVLCGTVNAVVIHTNFNTVMLCVIVS